MKFFLLLALAVIAARAQDDELRNELLANRGSNNVRPTNGFSNMSNLSNMSNSRRGARTTRKSITIMTKGTSKSDCERQKAEYCQEIQYDCKNGVKVAYIYGSVQNVGDCFMTFNVVLTGVTKAKLLTIYDNVQESSMSKSVKDKYESMRKDRIVEVAGKQTDAPWGLAKISNSNAQISNPKNPQGFEFVHQNYGAGTKVFVLDTGMDREWANGKDGEFQGRVAVGKDFTNENIGTVDSTGHGTHVAGTSLGKKHGVAKKATLIPVKVLGGYNPDGEKLGGGGYWSWFINGMEWVQSQCRKGDKCVVNMSLSGWKDKQVNKAVDDLVDSGVVVVVAAGNDNVDACSKSPASASKAITVGAHDYEMKRSLWLIHLQNGGTRLIGSNFGNCVDIWAPGSDVLSTDKNGKTVYMGGTSMAAPHVAGVVAELLRTSSERGAAVKQALLQIAKENLISDTKSTKSGFVQLPNKHIHFRKYSDKCLIGGFQMKQLTSVEACEDYCISMLGGDDHNKDICYAYDWMDRTGCFIWKTDILVSQLEDRNDVHTWIRSTTPKQILDFQAVGRGFCRNEHNIIKHPWSTQMSCHSLPSCKERCRNTRNCEAIAWASKPNQNWNGCKARGQPRCILYVGSHDAAQVNDQYKDYTCYEYDNLSKQLAGRSGRRLMAQISHRLDRKI